MNFSLLNYTGYANPLENSCSSRSSRCIFGAILRYVPLSVKDPRRTHAAPLSCLGPCAGQVCGRTQGDPDDTYKRTHGFANYFSGYCCYLNTNNATHSNLEIRKAGRTFVAGPSFKATTG